MPSMPKLFTKHYAMERFSIVFAIICVVFVLLFIWVLGSIRTADEAAFADKALYAERVVGSKSGVGMKILGIAEDKSRTKATIVVQFEDTSKIPTRATDWNMHMTGMNKDHAKRTIPHPVAGEFTMFGVDGYAVVSLVSSEQFESDLYYLALESTRNTGSEATSDGSYSDIYEIVFNPGANQVQYSPTLDADGFDLEGVFADLVIKESDDKARETLASDLETMSKALVTLHEAYQRLEEDGISTTGMTPELVAGDSIVNGEDDSWSVKFSEDVPNAIKIDWQKTQLGDYAAALGLDQSQLVNYISRYKAGELPDEELVWKFTNGTTVESAKGSAGETERMERISSNISMAETAMETYTTFKKSYQTKDMLELLTGERNLYEVSESMTSKEGLDVY